MQVLSYDEVSSTNDLVKRAIEAGETANLVVCARKQSGGYGRDGRLWESPLGGLYFSMLLRPANSMQHWSTLPLLVGMAVREGLSSLLEPSVASSLLLKWPNDVVLGEAAVDKLQKVFRKLCGISSEVYQGALCVGVGINVLRPKEAEEISLVGRNIPAYLEDLPAFCSEGIDVLDAIPQVCHKRLQCGATKDTDILDMVLQAVLDAFWPLYESWQVEGFAPLKERYQQVSALQGHAVQVLDRRGSVLASGVVCGIDTEGRLLLEDEDQRICAVSSGEAHIRPC